MSQGVGKKKEERNGVYDLHRCRSIKCNSHISVISEIGERSRMCTWSTDGYNSELKTIE